MQDSSWALIDGIITLLLGWLIYLQWPPSFAWVIGVGRGGTIISGITSIMLWLAVRKAAAKVSSRLAA
jgi:hypothetical protein